MARVLLVSKPVVPPWNDSSKNLARVLASAAARHALTVLTDGREPGLPARVERAPVYRAPGSYAPALCAQLAVLGALARGPRRDLWHFFFAPNRRSSVAAGALARARSVPTVHTVCSRPRLPETSRRLLFAERSVVVSRASYAALVDAGVPEARLARIPPAVPPLEAPDEAARRAAREALGLPDAPLVVYPGDLEHGRGAARMIEAFADPALGRDAVLVMACRDKTSRAREVEASLRRRARPLGERVRWLGETPHIHGLLGAADVVALPSVDLYAKMDLPLVLIEAMWLARAVVVAEGSPAAELAEDDAAHRVEPRPGALAAALRGLLDDDAARAASGARARQAAARRYAPAAMARAYETLYDELT